MRSVSLWNLGFLIRSWRTEPLDAARLVRFGSLFTVEPFSQVRSTLYGFDGFLGEKVDLAEFGEALQLGRRTRFESFSGIFAAGC